MVHDTKCHHFGRLGGPVLLCTLLFSGLLMGVSSLDGGPAVHYVAPGGDCGGAAPCYATVQAAVDAVQAGDEIRIAGGVYTGVHQVGELWQLVYLSRTVTLRGGYAVQDWQQSQPQTWPTTLDAEGRGRVLYITGPITARIENLRLEGGDATGLDGSSPFQGFSAGGGIYAVTATVTMSNTTLSRNGAYVGGAVYGGEVTLSLVHSAVLSNTGLGSEAQGAGLYLFRSNSLVSDSVIAHNLLEEGTWSGNGGLVVNQGAIHLLNSQIISNSGGVQVDSAQGLLTGNTITDNFSLGCAGVCLGGGPLSTNISLLYNTIARNSGGVGAGLYLGSWGATISVIGNDIVGNRSNSIGGGVMINLSTSLADSGRKLLAGNVISGNVAGDSGGGIFCQNAQPELVGNRIENNSAQGNGDTFFAGRGGGIFLNICRASLDGDVLVGNVAEREGGGIFLNYPAHLANLVLAENRAGTEGSALYVYNSYAPVQLSQATVANNPGSSGIFVYGDPQFEFAHARLMMTNTILSGHMVAVRATEASTVTINGVLWHSNQTNLDGQGVFSLTHEVMGDPGFALDGYHLAATSAARDSGVPEEVFRDIDLEPRPYGQFDLGADEFWPAGALRRTYAPLVFDR